MQLPGSKASKFSDRLKPLPFPPNGSLTHVYSRPTGDYRLNFLIISALNLRVASIMGYREKKVDQPRIEPVMNRGHKVDSSLARTRSSPSHMMV